MIDLTQLTTETRNPRTTDLDEWSALEIITEMNREDLDVVDAVRKELPRIACLAEVCTQALKKGGRIVYIGAGTSGRLGVLDAVECPPTFGVSDNCVVGLIAGGAGAYVKAVEGAEDSLTLAEKDLRKIALTADDVVIGLAASGRTPFVIGGCAMRRVSAVPQDQSSATETQLCLQRVITLSKSFRDRKYLPVPQDSKRGPLRKWF